MDVDDEVEEMQAEADANASSEVASILDVLRDPSIKWQMICISTLHAVQQLCGINAVRERDKHKSCCILTSLVPNFIWKSFCLQLSCS